MLNISELSKEDKIKELLNDVERKYSTFSIGNTLFPKIRINNNELIIFFESFTEQINEIAYSPAMVRNSIVNGQVISIETAAIRLSALNIYTLINIVKNTINSESGISFYDVSFDKETGQYCCRIFVYDDPIKMKVKNRDNKINQVLNDR